MPGFYRNYGKRSLDVAVAGLGLVALLPVLGAVAILVRVRLGSPVLFRQERPGLLGQPFLLIKFRSMANGASESGELQPDSERLGSFGRLLRSTSLDELPELINVVRGDMSLVGPRPLLMQYVPLYSAEQSRRHDVRPGVTGWAQVNGRNKVGWSDRFVLDVWYADNVSFVLDMRILWRTIADVVRRRGVSVEGQATMPPFEG